MKPVTDRQLEHVVGRLLHWGLVFSGASMAAGFLIYAVRIALGASPDGFAHDGFLSVMTTSSVTALLLHPLAYLYLGILLLASTPVARVAITIVIFALEKDRRYVRISSLVLAILFASILIAFLQ